MTNPQQPNPQIAKKVLRIRAIQWAIQSLVGIAVFSLVARHSSWGIWLLIAWCLVVAANGFFLWKRLRPSLPKNQPE